MSIQGVGKVVVVGVVVVVVDGDVDVAVEGWVWDMDIQHQQLPHKDEVHIETDVRSYCYRMDS